MSEKDTLDTRKKTPAKKPKRSFISHLIGFFLNGAWAIFGIWIAVEIGWIDLATASATGSAGFWDGLEHGSTALIALGYQICMAMEWIAPHNIAIYQANNTGLWYDVPYILSLMGIAYLLPNSIKELLKD